MMGSTSESSTDAVYTYEPVVQTWSKFSCVTCYFVCHVLLRMSRVTACVTC